MLEPFRNQADYKRASRSSRIGHISLVSGVCNDLQEVDTEIVVGTRSTHCS